MRTQINKKWSFEFDSEESDRATLYRNGENFRVVTEGFIIDAFKAIIAVREALDEVINVSQKTFDSLNETAQAETSRLRADLKDMPKLRRRLAEKTEALSEANIINNAMRSALAKQGMKVVVKRRGDVLPEAPAPIDECAFDAAMYDRETPATHNIAPEDIKPFGEPE